MQQRTHNDELDLEPGDFEDRDTTPAPEEDDIDGDVDDGDELDEPAGDEGDDGEPG
jgi:hypothetical protein